MQTLKPYDYWLKTCTMLDDMPTFESTVSATESDLAAKAIAQAKIAGSSSPITYPINTKWDGFNASIDSDDWFYAVGSFDHNLNGSVTVYPPSVPGGEWRYEMDTQVNIRDQYNWDTGKSVTIGPLEVSDEELQDFHRKGIAQEFTMVGNSRHRKSSGVG